MPRKKTTRRLADELRSTTPVHWSTKYRWWQKVAPAVRRQLDEVKAEYKAGAYTQLSLAQIYRIAKARFDIPVGYKSFYNWMEDRDP